MNVARAKMSPGAGVAVWLAAFLSPSAFFLLIILLSNSRAINPAEMVVWALFVLVPAGALMVCEWVAWSCSRTVRWRIGWMVFTLVALGVQFAVIVVILRAILVATISYGQ